MIELFFKIIERLNSYKQNCEPEYKLIIETVNKAFIENNGKLCLKILKGDKEIFSCYDDNISELIEGSVEFLIEQQIKN